MPSLYASTGHVDEMLVTIVAASDYPVDFDAFVASAMETGRVQESKFVTDARMSDPVEHLFEDDLTKFKKQVALIFHENEEHQRNFIEEFSLQLLSLNALIGQHKEMLEAIKEEKERLAGMDQRTVAELNGIGEHDPWEAPVTIGVKNQPKNVTGQGGQGGTPGELKKPEKAGSVVISKAEVDRDGNVQLDGHVLSAADKKRSEELREKHEKMAAEKRQEDLERVHAAAKAVGLDPTVENTEVHLQSDGTVVHIDSNIDVLGIYKPGKSPQYSDTSSGNMIDEKEVRRRQLKKELDNLDSDTPDPNATVPPVQPVVSQPAAPTPNPFGPLHVEIEGDTTADYYFAVHEELTLAQSRIVFARKAEFDVDSTVFVSDDMKDTLHRMGYDEASLGVYTIMEAYNPDTDQARNRSLQAKISENPKVLEKLLGGDPAEYPWQLNKMGKRVNDLELNQIAFAVLPPGYLADTDEDAAFLGQKTYIAFAPVSELTVRNYNPNTDKSIIPNAVAKTWLNNAPVSKESDAVLWQMEHVVINHVRDGIFEFCDSTGRVTEGLMSRKFVQDGRVLELMGFDLDKVPFDWPFRYHGPNSKRKSHGSRFTEEDLYTIAIRAIQAAQEAGMDFAGDYVLLGNKNREIDLSAHAPKGEDITLDLKDELAKQGIKLG